MNKEIGLFIRQLRNESGITQEQLAERLGVSNRSVSRWENGSTLPDLQLMKCICELFHISISELINAQKQSLVTDKENMGEKVDIRAREAVHIILKLAEYEMKQKTKAIAFYFFFGMVGLGILALHTLMIISGFMDAVFLDSRQTLVFFILGLMAEIAGFYINSKNKVFTSREVDLLLCEEHKLQMKEGEEMLQFARKNQNYYFQQHKKAFHVISQRLEEGEYVVFTMLSEEYSINDSPGIWHGALAVSNRRLLLSGESIKGRMLTSYSLDAWKLKEIKRIEKENSEIVIVMDKDKVKLKGRKIEEMAENLEKSVTGSLI